MRLRPDLKRFNWICNQIRIKSRRIEGSFGGAFDHEPVCQELLDETEAFIDAIQKYTVELYEILESNNGT